MPSTATPDPLDSQVSRDLAQELEVGEVPDLPPLWQTYRKQIVAFAAVAMVVLLGVYTQFFTSVGAFGLPALVAMITAEAPPAPPPAPPPPPAKVADPKEVANLIEEHSYESFRSAFATLKAGGRRADDQLALARARGLATLAYGPKVFSVDALKEAVESLNTVDLSRARESDATTANLSIAKSRAGPADRDRRARPGGQSTGRARRSPRPRQGTGPAFGTREAKTRQTRRGDRGDR